jgi:hypothetical protein
MSKGDARLQVTQWDSAPPLREGSQAQAMSDVIFLLWSVNVADCWILYYELSM